MVLTRAERYRPGEPVGAAPACARGAAEEEGRVAGLLLAADEVREQGGDGGGGGAAARGAGRPGYRATMITTG